MRLKRKTVRFIVKTIPFSNLSYLKKDLREMVRTGQTLLKCSEGVNNSLDNSYEAEKCSSPHRGELVRAIACTGLILKFIFVLFRKVLMN